MKTIILSLIIMCHLFLKYFPLATEGLQLWSAHIVFIHLSLTIFFVYLKVTPGGAYSRDHFWRYLSTVVLWLWP